MMTEISFSGYRFLPEIIQQAIWLYVRFTLSFRDVAVMPKRKLENSTQRPAPASLTNGNVGDSPPPGNDTPETGLPS
jgi:hypothetical protein